jgi:hypothetical protein
LVDYNVNIYCQKLSAMVNKIERLYVKSYPHDLIDSGIFIRAKLNVHIIIKISSICGVVVYRDRMVVGFTTTSAISAYHHSSCELEPRSWRDVLDTTLCDKVCQ